MTDRLHSAGALGAARRQWGEENARREKEKGNGVRNYRMNGHFSRVKLVI